VSSPEGENEEFVVRLDEAAERLRGEPERATAPAAHADDPFRRALADLERATVEVCRARDRLAELEALLRPR
jgi:hypothetical protein